jgi:hypothetical protein
MSLNERYPDNRTPSIASRPNKSSVPQHSQHSEPPESICAAYRVEVMAGLEVVVGGDLGGVSWADLEEVWRWEVGGFEWSPQLQNSTKQHNK